MKELGLWILVFLVWNALCALGLFLERKQPFPSSAMLWTVFLFIFCGAAILRFLWLLIAAWFT
jgi:hypothetical protein